MAGHRDLLVEGNKCVVDPPFGVKVVKPAA